MTYPEDDLIPLSALQHLLFCERQCALIHVERVWVENRWTAEGRILHRNAHDAKTRTRDGVRITHGLPLRSFELGVTGQADVVEWRPPSGVSDHGADRTLADLIQAAQFERLADWSITPIEYKRGRPKSNDCDRVQLCAQAICLEEMLGVNIARGQLFYGRKRRRFDVSLDEPLRATTRRAAARLHELMELGVTPPAVHEKKCDTCSLLQVCLPQATSGKRSARSYFERELAAILSDTQSNAASSDGADGTGVTAPDPQRSTRDQ